MHLNLSWRVTNHSWHTHSQTQVNRRARQGEITLANKQTRADLVDLMLMCRANTVGEAHKICTRVVQTVM